MNFFEIVGIGVIYAICWSVITVCVTLATMYFTRRYEIGALIFGNIAGWVMIGIGIGIGLVGLGWAIAQ